MIHQSPRSERARPGRSTAGFSVAEMLVALVMSSVVVGSVVVAFIGHTRFVERMSLRTEQAEQVRSALLLMNAEFADLPSGSVVVAEADSVTFRLPRFWGVMCGRKDRKTAQQKPNPEDDGYMFIADFDDGQFRRDDDLRGFAIFEDGMWRYYDVAQWSQLDFDNDNDDAFKTCLGEEREDDNVADKAQYYKLEDLGKDFFEAEPRPTPRKGSIITLYVEVSYSFRSEGNSSELVLYRGGVDGSYALVGPFSLDAGFHYRLADGTERTAVTGASLYDIRQVQVSLPATQARRTPWAREDSLTAAPWLSLGNAF